MAFFENYNNRQNVVDQLDNALEGVETRIDSVQDQLSSLGGSAQMTPLINDLRTTVDYMNQLKQATGPELTEGFLKFKTSVESLLNTMNNSNTNGLTNIKDTVNEIYKTLQDINNLSSMNHLNDGIDKLSNLLDTISVKSTNFKEIINNVDMSNMSNELQQHLTTIDNFMNNVPGKFQELKNGIKQSMSINPEDFNGSIEVAVEDMKSKMNDFASYVSDNLKIGEIIVNNLDGSSEAVENLKKSMESMVQSIQNGLDSISFDEQNKQVQFLIDNVGKINEESFSQFNENLNLSSEVVKVLNENFGRMLDNIEKNNRSVESLSDIINQLNNGNNINFDTNISEIIKEAQQAKDAINSLTDNNVNVDPNVAIEQYEKIKAANDEMKRIKEDIVGASINSNNGLALSELLKSSGKEGTGVYYSDIQNNETLINSAQHLQDALSQYGDVYKGVVESLGEQITELENERERLNGISNREKISIPRELRETLHDTNNEYTQMVNFQLLGNRKSITHGGLDFLEQGINGVGNDAIKIENSVREYKRKANNPYSGLTEEDQQKTKKVFEKTSLDGIVDQSKDLQRLVNEFNKNKNALLDGVKKAVSTGSKDDIENAKADMIALLDFSEDLLNQTKIMGDAITIKSFEQFETLPDQVKGIINNIQDLVGHTQSMVYDTIDLADAFGLNTVKVKQLNDELDLTQDKINNTANSSSTMLDTLSKGWKSFNKILSAATSAASVIGIHGLSLKSYISDAFKYSRDRGQMAADSYMADISLGADFNADKAFDRGYNKALEYYSASNGLIGFDEYNKSYLGLSQNVGGQVGKTGQQTIDDLTTINEETFALSKVYGISDSTIQQATKTFYQDFGMTAKETTNMINEMVQAARSANVPIDKYVSQMASLAANYKSIGLEGKDAQNIMNNMILSGMNVDMAFDFSSAAGRAVNTFANNKSLNGYFGILSGVYNDPFSAIVGAQDKYDGKGNLRSEYLDNMTAVMDTALASYANLGPNGSPQQKMIIQDILKSQFGFDEKNADIAVDAYLDGGRTGFEEWFKNYEETQGSEQILQVEGQDELIEKIKAISDQLDETQKIQALRNEQAYRLSLAAEQLGDSYLNPLRESIDNLSGNIIDLILSLSGGLAQNVPLIGGIATAGAALYGGSKLYKGGKHLYNKISKKFATNSDEVTDLITHGDEIADITVDASKLNDVSKVPWGKLAKAGLAGGAVYGLYKAFNWGQDLFTFDNNKNNAQYIDQNDLYTYHNNQNMYIDPYQQFLMHDYVYSNNKTEAQKTYQSYINYDVGSGKENNLLTGINFAATIGGDQVGSNILSKTLTKSLGGSTVGNVVGYGVGDVIYGVGSLAQKGIQGDYVDGDIQKSIADILMGGGGSVLGATIGSAFGPIGTFAGGLVGGLGTSLLDLIKLDNGKGLGTTMTDGISVMMGGSTSEELEYKRAIINNPEELLKHRNEMLGISQDQSDQIDITMETHAKELDHLTEEQKTAMKALCGQLMNCGETVDQAFGQLSELFSEQNIEDTMNKLSDGIKKAIEGAELPKGWKEKDVEYVSEEGKKAIETAKHEKLNSASYISDILSKNGVAYDEIEDLKLLGSSGWEKAYNNTNDVNHELAVNLIDNWMSKDLEKAAKKARKDAEEKIEKRNKEENKAKAKKESERNNAIQTVVTEEIFGEDTSLLKTYINKLIKDSKKSLSNLKSSGKGEGDFEYDDVNSQLLGYESYLEYLKEVDKQKNIAKEKFADGKRKVKTKNMFGFKTTKEYNNEKDYVDAYLKSLELEAKGLANTTLYGDNLKVKARDYLVESVKKGTNSDLYKNNPQIKKLIEDQNKNADDSKAKLEKSIGIQDNTLTNMLISNTTTSNILKTLGKTNENIEQLSKNMIMTTINGNTGNGEHNYYKYNGTNSGEVQSNIFQTALIDTAANVKNYNGEQGKMQMDSDAAKIDSFFKGKKMQGYGRTYVEAAAKYGVDPMLLASITHAEYSGNPGILNNVGGIRSSSSGNEGLINSPYASYSSLENGIYDLARIIKEVYYDQGLTSIAEIKSKYCPDDDPADKNGLNGHWTKNVSGAYSKLNNSSVNYLATSDGNTTAQQLYSGNYSDITNITSSGAKTNISGNSTNSYSVGSKLADIAMQQEGAPYLWAAEGSTDWDNDGDSRAGYDCSGLVSYAAHMAGIDVGRLTATGLYNKCIKISESELQKGDLGFTKSASGSISHVGVYCGEGKWVHAPQPGENVKIVSNAGFNCYGRLPGSNGVASDVDISQFAFSGSNSAASNNISSVQSAYDSVMSSDLFSTGSMLYGIVPSDYSSNFTNDATQRTNYAQLVTDAFAESGGNGLGNTIYSQNHSRIARLNWEASSGYEMDSIYKDVIDTAAKNAEKSKKDYNINVKLDSNAGDSKLEKQIQSILQDALNKIENLGVSVSSLEDSVSLLDQSLYSVRGG